MLADTLKLSVSITATSPALGMVTNSRRVLSCRAQSVPGRFNMVVAKVLVAPAMVTSGSTTEMLASLFINTTK
jgi:hypothetical protein